MSGPAPQPAGSRLAAFAAVGLCAFVASATTLGVQLATPKAAPAAPQGPAVEAKAPEPAKAPDLPAAPPADALPAASTVPMVTLATGAKVKLGRQHPTRRPKLWLHDYVRLPKAASPPASVDYTAKATASLSQMYGNDVWGDCVPAGAMHFVGVWTAYGLGTPAVGTTAEAVATYHRICGAGDNGCNMMDFLDHWQADGIAVGGKVYRIAGYVGIDWTNQEMVEYATSLFGGVYFGVNLPAAWESAQTWDATSTRIVGGHCIDGLAYDASGMTISTWAGTRKWTWAAVKSKRWTEEAYAILDENWAKSPDLARLGIDVVTLRADLALIAQGRPPIIPPTPPPAPAPDPVTPPDPGPVNPPAPVPGPAPTAATFPPGRARYLANIIDLDTAGEIALLKYGDEWYQPSRDGKIYKSKSLDALGAWIIQHDATIKAGPAPEPVQPPQTGRITITGTYSLGDGLTLPLPIGVTPAPSAQSPP